MRVPALLLAVAWACLALTSCVHEPAGSSNRTISVTANESVTVEPDLAILRVGFDTPEEDAKSAYADGARISNQIVDVLRNAGISVDAIRSESQYLYRSDGNSSHKFKLAQQWTVNVSPERAAEILDIAVSAGANSSGQIEWTVKDEKALEHQALDRATARVGENAVVLAQGTGVHLGKLISVSNQFAATPFAWAGFGGGGGGVALQQAPPLSIEPNKVTRSASVSAVYAIE